jgi:hypothetical protein
MTESHRDAEDRGLDYSTAPHVPVAAPAQSPRWIAPVALLLSLLAVAAAGWSLFKPAPNADAKPAVFTATAVDDPKAAACKAAALVASGVMRQSQVNLGVEPAALETVAANTRLAMTGGALYLRDTVPSNTPPELAEPIATLATQLQDAAQYFLVGQTSNDPEQAGRLDAAGQTTAKIADLCK